MRLVEAAVLLLQRDRALDLWDALVDALNPQGMKVIGMVALDLFRIEGGFAKFRTT